MSVTESEIVFPFSDYIRHVPDFPKPGILFYDITPLLNDARAFGASVDALAMTLRKWNVNKIASPEARGFLFGPVLAAQLGVGFVPVRKPNKLPWKTISITYELEYGEDKLFIHEDAFAEGDRVAIVDDLLATGGTALATRQIIEKTPAKAVGFACLMELTALKGVEKLAPLPVFSLIKA